MYLHSKGGGESAAQADKKKAEEETKKIEEAKKADERADKSRKKINRSRHQTPNLRAFGFQYYRSKARIFGHW
jgi:hypothetical protein